MIYDHVSNVYITYVSITKLVILCILYDGHHHLKLLCMVLVGALQALTLDWENLPPSWNSGDPCDSGWEGITCTNSRITGM